MKRKPVEYLGIPVASDEMQRIAYDLHADEHERIATEVRVSDDPVNAMLAALLDALDADMESGAQWMNEAAHAEFSRKYPRFTTLFAYARHIDWSRRWDDDDRESAS